VWDAAGRRYLDFVSGFGSLNLGHNHPAVAAAVQQAVATQAPGFAQSAVNPYAAALAERLVSFAPASLEMVFLANSGTEAVEAALKLARITSARQGLLYCDRSYHGKSLGSLSVTGNPNYQRPFGDLLPRTESVPYGDLPALRESLSRRKFAAFIVEPMQCEGGMFVPPRGYLKEAQAICHRYGTLLVVDEVQTGLGRTGAMFAVDREGVEPDVMTLAKSLGGGMMPIGAMLCRRDLWIKAYGSVDTFALHTSTFGGGSLACAAALATLGVLDDGQLIENARQRGRQLYDGLAELADRCELVGQVRGQGLLLGLEFRPLPENIVEHFQATDPTGTSQFVVPGATEVIRNVPAMYVMQTLLHEYGIYTQVTRSRPGVLRVQPPLMISEEQVDWFLRSVSEASEELAFSNRITDAMIAKTGLGQHERQSPDETPLPTTR